MVDLNNEKARKLLRAVLENSTVPTNILDEEERRIVTELIREGYLKECVSPGPRIGEAMEALANSIRITVNRCHRYSAVITLSVTILMIYITARALMMGYTTVTIFLTIVTMILAPMTHRVITWICTRIKMIMALHV